MSHRQQPEDQRLILRQAGNVRLGGRIGETDQGRVTEDGIGIGTAGPASKVRLLVQPRKAIIRRHVCRPVSDEWGRWRRGRHGDIGQPEILQRPAHQLAAGLGRGKPVAGLELHDAGAHMLQQAQREGTAPVGPDHVGLHSSVASPARMMAPRILLPSKGTTPPSRVVTRGSGNGVDIGGMIQNVRKIRKPAPAGRSENHLNIVSNKTNL